MRRELVGLGLGVMVFGLFTASTARADDPPPPGTIKFCSDTAFTQCKDTVAPGETVFVRAEFPKPVGVVFKELMGMPDVPSSGKYVFVIAKNLADEKPIIELSGSIFPSRYEKPGTNTYEKTLQASDELLEKLQKGDEELTKTLSFNGKQTIADKGLTTLWMQQAVKFKSGNTPWEAFLIFLPSYGDQGPKLAAAGKFTYAMDAEGKKKLAAGMNFYDKQRFEILPDDGVTTKIHKANVEKIVFGKVKMKKGHDNEGDLVTSFKSLSDGVYARVYLKQSMRNSMAEMGGGKDTSDTYYDTELSVDDGKVTRRVQDKLSKDEALKLTSWSLTLVPANAEDAKDMPEMTRKFVYLVSMMEPGKHKVKITTYATVQQENQAISSGTIELNITAADRDAVVKKWGNRLGARGLLDKEPGLEAGMKAVLGKSAIAVAAPMSWELRKNGLGIVTHRVAQAEASYKEKGECRRVVEMIQQDKKGAGWGPTHRSVEKIWGGIDTDLPCQNVSTYAK